MKKTENVRWIQHKKCELKKIEKGKGKGSFEFEMSDSVGNKNNLCAISINSHCSKIIYVIQLKVSRLTGNTIQTTTML